MAKRSSPGIDLAMYVRALPLLARHPSVMVMPLLAAVIDVLVDQAMPLFTNPLGGAGGGLFQMLVQLVYLWCFGVAIIQASNIWRSRRGSFDEAWEEGRVKFGGILLAAIGFQFIVWAASYIGSFVGAIGLLLGAVAAFFLIYTIPAAAIGGMPGSLAISASIRGVRAAVPASIVLAIVFFALWYFAVPVLLPYALVNLSPLVWKLVIAAARALVLGYLAFPFAKQYDDVAFRGYW
ncbi:MAG TPA: hypothetical protein VNG31_02210 [Candidatus Baltobacteraceae bacterium]|nr:hypothetical protein [Candidatus Baltobacteraceae bacterium]